jgi:hypothetical protein
MSYCNEQATTTLFFILHCKGASKYNKNSNIAQDASLSCKGVMTTQHQKLCVVLQEATTLIPFLLYREDKQLDSIVISTLSIARSSNKDECASYVVSQ